MRRDHILPLLLLASSGVHCWDGWDGSDHHHNHRSQPSAAPPTPPPPPSGTGTRIIRTSCTAAELHEVRWVGDVLYVANGCGLDIFDRYMTRTEVLRSVVLEGSKRGGPPRTRLSHSGTTVAIANGPLGTALLDVSSPSAPTLRTTIPIHGAVSHSVAVVETDNGPHWVVLYEVHNAPPKAISYRIELYQRDVPIKTAVLDLGEEDGAPVLECFGRTLVVVFADFAIVYDVSEAAYPFQTSIFPHTKKRFVAITENVLLGYSPREVCYHSRTYDFEGRHCTQLRRAVRHDDDGVNSDDVSEAEIAEEVEEPQNGRGLPGRGRPSGPSRRWRNSTKPPKLPKTDNGNITSAPRGNVTAGAPPTAPFRSSMSFERLTYDRSRKTVMVTMSTRGIVRKTYTEAFTLGRGDGLRFARSLGCMSGVFSVSSVAVSASRNHVAMILNTPRSAVQIVKVVDLNYADRMIVAVNTSTTGLTRGPFSSQPVDSKSKTSGTCLIRHPTKPEMYYVQRTAVLTFDISSPDTPHLLKTVTPGKSAFVQDCTIVAGRFLVVASDALHSYDIGDERFGRGGAVQGHSDSLIGRTSPHPLPFKARHDLESISVFANGSTVFVAATLKDVASSIIAVYHVSASQRWYLRSNATTLCSDVQFQSVRGAFLFANGCVFHVGDYYKVTLSADLSEGLPEPGSGVIPSNRIDTGSNSFLFYSIGAVSQRISVLRLTERDQGRRGPTLSVELVKTVAASDAAEAALIHQTPVEDVTMLSVLPIRGGFAVLDLFTDPTCPRIVAQHAVCRNENKYNYEPKVVTSSDGFIYAAAAGYGLQSARLFSDSEDGDGIMGAGVTGSHTHGHEDSDDDSESGHHGRRRHGHDDDDDDGSDGGSKTALIVLVSVSSLLVFCVVLGLLKLISMLDDGGDDDDDEKALEDMRRCAAQGVVPSFSQPGSSCGSVVTK